MEAITSSITDLTSPFHLSVDNVPFSSESWVSTILRICFAETVFKSALRIAVATCCLTASSVTMLTRGSKYWKDRRNSPWFWQIFEKSLVHQPLYTMTACSASRLAHQSRGEEISFNEIEHQMKVVIISVRSRLVVRILEAYGCLGSSPDIQVNIGVLSSVTRED